MCRSFNQVLPDHAVALCSREQAEKLVRYDYHVVQVRGRAGVMLTYEWMPLEEHTGPLVLTVVFQHVEKHPSAPEEVQTIVDSLRFQVRGQPR
jgi:hypothetical protein